jgi:hypothetical protein
MARVVLEQRSRSGCGTVVLLAILGFVGYVIIFNSLNKPIEAGPREMALRAIGKLGRPPGWDRIEITEAKENSYSLTLIYTSTPANPAAVGLDTYRIGRAMLDELVASGLHPSRDRTSLWIWAQSPAGRGETGEKLVRIHGHTEYNYSTDGFEFKPWKP